MAGPDGYNSMNAKYRGLVKPDVVFFGERLPERFVELGVQFTRFSRTKVQILMQERYAAIWHPSRGLTLLVSEAFRYSGMRP